MKYLVEEGIIHRSKTFIDLGSGAGDVTTVVAHVFDIPTIGIEFDSVLVDYAIKITNEVSKFLETQSPRYIQGDYTNTDYYTSVEIGTLFNYLSGDISNILEMVPEETLLLSYLAGGDDSKLMSGDHLLKLNSGYSRYQHLSSSLRKRIIDRLVHKFDPWDFVLTIPETKIHVYKKGFRP